VLTRLKVDGFKNLDGIDVRLGPFTCVAGPNGVGKSNLFDAIAFLAALADRPLVEAASIVRGGDADNPLRQVIVNTHSPSVVACVHDDALLVAHAGRGNESVVSRLSIRHLPDTWRDGGDADDPTVARGDLLAYLNPLQSISLASW